MGKIWLIVKKEYSTRVWKSSFLYMAIIGPLIIASFILMAVWLKSGESGRQKVLVADEIGVYGNTFKNSRRVEFFVDTTSRTKEEFLNSEFDLLLNINPKIIQNNKAKLYYKHEPSLQTLSYIKGIVDRALENYKIDDHKINKDEFDLVKTNTNILMIDIYSGKEDTRKKKVAWVGFFFAVFIFFFIFIYGIQVTRGVLEEKTSRIVEVIISSVKPFQLMMGKIIGVALVAFTQFGIWALFTFLILKMCIPSFFPDQYDPVTLTQNQEQMAVHLQVEDAVSLNDAPPDLNEVLELLYYDIQFGPMLLLFLFYFIGGYLLYASLFAAIGAAVDSGSDVQQYLIPIVLPLLLSFVAGWALVDNPDGGAAFWFSIIPFTSPIVMMFKVAIGIPATDMWQLYLSMGLLIVGFFISTWMAGKIYRTGILLYGKKANYREIWKWLFYRK
jgi:ABC-2 type transport system permease protein